VQTANFGGSPQRGFLPDICSHPLHKLRRLSVPAQYIRVVKNGPRHRFRDGLFQPSRRVPCHRPVDSRVRASERWPWRQCNDWRRSFENRNYQACGQYRPEPLSSPRMERCATPHKVHRVPPGFQVLCSVVDKIEDALMTTACDVDQPFLVNIEVERLLTPDIEQWADRR